jgi:tRNA-modifying protein YgfZ
MTPIPEVLAGYEAALTRVAFIRQPGAGYLRIQGADRRNFLQRQSTNDLNRLGPGVVLVTVLTSPTARIQDVLSLFEEDSETTAALPLPGQAEGTFQYLKSRIFFMDKVTLEDASPAYAQFDLIGPQAAGVVRQLGLERIPGPGELSRWELGETWLLLFSDGALGFRLLFPAENTGQVQAALEKAGAAHLAAESYTTLRIEAGLPAAGAELTEEFTPLETGLGWAVSEGKGCYTGQEVIARQLTYDKVTQHLVGLRLSAPTSPGVRLMSAEQGRPVGRVTSAAVSPRFGPIALAVVRRPYEAPGVLLTMGDGPQAASATVAAVPFSTSSP